MSDKYWEIVEYECQDGKCLMIHNIPKDSKLGALSLNHRDIGEAIVDLLNEQQDIIFKLQDLCGKSDGENAKLRIENKKLKAKLREKEEDERLYANEILELRETNKEHIKFKSLGGDY